MKNRTQKTLITAAAVIALSGAAAVPASAAPELGSEQSVSASSDSSSQAVGQELLSMMNDARAQAGLSPLSSHAELDAISGDWSSQMAASNSATHNPSFIEQTQATGSTNMAENISYDVESKGSAHATAQYFFDFWMNSPAHRANIMNPDFTHVGFGSAESGNGYVYGTQNFGTY
ncbi:CAP domain-containing protein [Kocuria sp. JC486]|uniref:CAP domain-containing protein n=1 Tax=Kocuria soli TaxID=2485125 RepID=A0A3N3ZP40_9MICC|nr:MULTISPECIES: CAP domain-containing protein [Kocuria]NHU85483.1 CAP domain-containing protein [Kocuria sp. JC486]ROZ62692.1 CAP domain-containing protein [Kocuria soli]